MVKELMYIFCLGMFLFGATFSSFSQNKTRKDPFYRTIDSLDIKIKQLQAQIPRLQEGKSLNYYNIKRELDQTLFLKNYEELVHDENLQKAKEIIEERLKRAEFRRDENSMDYYGRYLKVINSEIKNQRIHYQEIFKKESFYKKELKKIFG
ncbi:MAG: hypothetical protein HC906_03515 [Bacteroidales bacterium]|nr:hypothetical protein [Bacteroidales bacterium]